MKRSIDLDLLKYQDSLRIKSIDNKRKIWDPIRKNYFVLTPEESVRQLLLIHLIESCKYNKNRIRVERNLENKLAEIKMRFDIIIYDWNMEPFMIIECKSPKVKIKSQALSQVSSYNAYSSLFNFPYVMVTNGIKTYCWEVDYENKAPVMLETIPVYPEKAGN